MGDILWTPWRLDFILGAKQPGCVLCQKIHDDPAKDPQNLVLYRGEYCAVILNLYPYSTGHLMVLPYLHTSDFVGLDQVTLNELADLSRRSVALLHKTHNPQGMNLGMNLGKVAGAGIDDHLHQHIVPRWNGDNNFMAVTGQTRLMPELLEQTYAKLAAARDQFFEPVPKSGEA
ncbi:MAG TPA: HIT domain-containing protein [Chloroflexia bacterium]|nr:HIT domain-containing protein [Chloroflexia bacterium]